MEVFFIGRGSSSFLRVGNVGIDNDVIICREGRLK